MCSSGYVAISLICLASLIRGDDAEKRLILDGDANVLHLIQTMKVEMTALNNTVHNLLIANQTHDAKIASISSTVYNLTLTNEAEESLIGALVRTIHNLTLLNQAHEVKIHLLEKGTNNDLDNNLVEYGFDSILKKLNRVCRDKTGAKTLSQVMSNLPAFMVTMTRSLSHCSEGQHVVFDNSLLNVGNVYDTRRGVFQAPVSGTYQFSLTLGLDVNAFHVGIVKGNVTNYIGNLYAVHDSNGDWRQRSTTVLVHLEKGDDVWVVCIWDESHIFGSNYVVEKVYSHFSGSLVSY